MNANRSAPLMSIELLSKFDVSGPRYTSYPTADRFIEAFDASTYKSWIEKRGLGGQTRPLSLYIHIPFCESICYYCACNKVITKDHGRAAKYIRYLQRELELVANILGGDPPAVQMHWGGGTPNFLHRSEMQELMSAIRRRFRLDPRGEYCVEIDPRRIAEGDLAFLAGLGFNRLSLGIQDFDPTVQRAVNRLQSEEHTLSAILEGRASGFKSINVDLIYGLPKQNVMGFNRTLERVIAAAPERIALYNYAHLPSVFKPQRRIAEADLPDAELRLRLLTLAIRRLIGAGYVYIGMDHFAVAGDELTVAQRQGRLHRNFQGYSTRGDCDLLGFGISSIGAVGPTYCQNVKALDEYYDRLDRGELPVLRGIELTADDLVRRALIQCLMCHFEVPIQELEIAHLIDFRGYFVRELEDLAQMQADGLLTLDRDCLTVTPLGRYFIRNICMVFDRYLREHQERARYSKAI